MTAAGPIPGQASTPRASTSRLLDLFGRTIVHLLTAAALALLLLAPDLVVQKFVLQTPLLFSVKYFLIFTLFTATLLFIKSNRSILLFLFFLMIMQITQFMNLVYFHDYLSPLALSLIWIENSDVLEVVWVEAGELFYGPAMIVASFALIYLITAKTARRRLALPYASVLVVLLLAIVPARVLAINDPIRFFPTASTPSLMNTLNAYALYATVLLPAEIFEAEASTGYQPYQVVRQQESRAKTIVVVMGEGISYRRMGLLGHSRPTTPRLSKLQQDGKLIAKRAISAGVSTRSAIPLFFNALREPKNRQAMSAQETNLFRLAKSAGFRTIYISAQKSNLLTGIGTGYIDQLITKDFYEDLFEAQRDDGILGFLNDLDLSGRNFVVLHQRALHAPYARAYENHPEFRTYDDQRRGRRARTKNAYDNGVLYYDWFIDTVIDTVAKGADTPLYVFATADHGQEMGEEGRFGHSHLTLNSARVPFLLYGQDADPRFLESIRSLEHPTPYELARSNAGLLGFEIVNPNEEAGVFYINGPRTFGRAGVLEIEKTGGAPPRVVRLEP
jgi:glucan phosphoethanolaminetransferase (alkaline phosphatase superfamily)